MRRKVFAIACCLVFSVVYFSYYRDDILSVGTNAEVKRPKIMLDCGHGGSDPGKIGVNGVKEKDLNLEIGILLKEKLEKEGFEVVMTRDTDIGLYSEGASNKKREDFNQRLQMMEEEKVDFVVSVHQNSFTEAKYKGAQVFYYTSSKEGEELASAIQKQMVSQLDPQNNRVEKGNTEYYLLRKSKVPMVIVECGFLSNPQECELLCERDYQEKVAISICSGILDYVNQ